MSHLVLRCRAVALAMMMAAALAGSTSANAEPVKVRHVEGIVHGFLSLRTLDGTVIADGDLIQLARGRRVTATLIFHFKDGSLHSETAVFSQQGTFHLVSDHLVQKGPTFPQPLDLSIDAASGQATVHYVDDHGTPQQETDRFGPRADLADGLILTLLKNVDPAAAPRAFSYVAATPKPRLVQLKLSVAGHDSFSLGGTTRSATHYVLKVDAGGISGLLAPLVGKQPPDSHVWILGGEAPAFVRAEQPLYVGGPVWRIELVSPTWRETTPR